MSPTHTKLRLIFLALLAVGLTAFATSDFLVIRQKNQEISTLINESLDASRKEVATQAIRAIRDASREEIAVFEAMPLTEKDLVPIIESLERAGRSLNLGFEIVSVEKNTGPAVKGSTPPQRIQFIIEGAGGWKGAYALLKAVENLPQRLIFDEARLLEDDSLWKTRLKFSLYSFN